MQGDDVFSLTCHGDGHPHSDPGLGRRARVWCPGPSGRWDGYQISHSASRGAETWPENKGNGTPEYRWSTRMVITTWDHFKHLQFGPEFEWREAMGKTGFSWQRVREVDVVWRALFLSSLTGHVATLPSQARALPALVHGSGLGAHVSFSGLIERLRPLDVFCLH